MLALQDSYLDNHTFKLTEQQLAEEASKAQVHL